MNLNNIEIRPRMTDNEIREMVAEHPSNGEYATDVCRECGNFYSNLDGNALTAKIHEECKKCCGISM